MALPLPRRPGEEPKVGPQPHAPAPEPERDRPKRLARAIALAVLSGTLTPSAAFDGFSTPTIVLIIVAFLVARAVVKSGLGQRLGYRAITLFGKSTLGLSYSIFGVDALISP